MNNVAAVRKAKGITQEKLAQLVGTESGHISIIEQGKSMPAIHIALRIADILETDPYKLFPGWKIHTKRKKHKHSPAE